MITQSLFNELVEKARKCKYSSMHYTDYDGCKNAEILHNSSELTLLQDKSQTPALLHFATDNYQLVLDALSKIQGELKLYFVPKEYKKQLENIGFTEWGEYVDFWNADLKNTKISVNDISEIDYLKPEEYKEAAEIPKKCMLQSRGFEGAPAEWYKEWLEENKIIVQRENGKIVGICCVTIYNEGTTVWVRELAVDPAYQGRGYGKKLIEQTIAYGIESGAVKGFLLADVLNKNAIGLYEKYNFNAKDDDSELQMISKSYFDKAVL